MNRSSSSSVRRGSGGGGAEDADPAPVALVVLDVALPLLSLESSLVEARRRKNLDSFDVDEVLNGDSG